MNTAAAYKYDDTAPLLTATRQGVFAFAEQAANDRIHYIGSIQNPPLPNPLPPAGEGANVARCADQPLEDANGNRTALTDPDNKVTRYSFDELNRVSTVTNSGGTTTYSYDRSSLKTEVIYPNGTNAATGYDGARRILNLINAQGAALVSSFSYSYDPNGNRTEQVENHTGTDEITSYGFDANDRLTSVNYPDQQTAYSFDANANRTSEITIASGNTTLHKTYTYNTRNQLIRVTDSITPANDAVYDFDANGNQTRKTQAATQTDYTYDVKDQLLSVSQNAANLGLFSYDYQGHRIVKDMGGSIVRYAYDGNSVLLETDTSGSTLAKFDYGPDRLLSMTHASEGRAYYLFDALGSVANLTTSAGAIQARYQYDAYGNYRNTDGASFNRFGFTGHEKDNETNLYYFKARYYDPDTGRFLNQDAYLGDVNTPPSLHRYLYAYGNPTVYVDLDGYESISASIDNAAEGCGAWSCAGWALAKGAYAASTFGFAVVHDPVSDQLDKGEITLSQYISRGIFGGAAMVGVNVAGVALGGVGSGATATLASTMARSAVTGGAISGGTDAVTQGVNIAAGLQDNYDVGRTAIATGAGAALGGMVPAAAAGLATPTVKAITSKVANAVSDTVANAGQAAKSVLTYEGKNLNVGSVPATVSGSVRAEASVGANSELAATTAGEGATQRLVYNHKLNPNKVTDITDLKNQLADHQAGMNAIIEKEGIEGLQARVGTYRTNPSIEAEGRAFAKSLGKADSGNAWLHAPDMATGGLPQDIVGQGPLRNNSILGGNATRVGNEILQMPPNTLCIVCELNLIK